MPKLNRYNLTDQIFEYIKDQIISGNWKAGEKIPSEIELSDSLGVSRMSLRAALQKTSALGLTETLVGEGTFVKEFNIRSFFQKLANASIIEWDHEQINDLRYVLQIGSVRFALLTPPPDWDAKLQQLKDSLHRMEVIAAENAWDEFLAIDVQVHRQICCLSDNTPLIMIYDAVAYLLNETMDKNLHASYHSTGSYDMVLRHHRDMIAAICARDLDSFIACILDARQRAAGYQNT